MKPKSDLPLSDFGLFRNANNLLIEDREQVWGTWKHKYSVKLSHVTKQICITSYNSTGFGLGAQNYIETLLLFSDICGIQEHFLLNSKSKKYSNVNKIKQP